MEDSFIDSLTVLQLRAFQSISGAIHTRSICKPISRWIWWSQDTAPVQDFAYDFDDAFASGSSTLEISEEIIFLKNLLKVWLNKTENLFSPYPRSVSDINWYTRLKIAMSCCLQGKLAINCRPTAVRKLAILPAYGRLLILCRARLPGKAAWQGCNMHHYRGESLDLSGQ
jgi:hypothetical protein